MIVRVASRARILVTVILAAIALAGCKTIGATDTTGSISSSTAQRYYASALKIVPDEPSVLSNLGLSYALSKDLKRALDRARQLQALAEPEPDEGQLTGSTSGTATEASAGDAYATAIFEPVRRNWSAPSGLVSDADLARLVTEVRIKIADDGTVNDVRLAKSSGNSYFDDSCVSAVQATRKLPPPPANFRKAAARGVSLDFAGKDIK